MSLNKQECKIFEPNSYLSTYLPEKNFQNIKSSGVYDITTHFKISWKINNISKAFISIFQRLMTVY